MDKLAIMEVFTRAEEQRTHRTKNMTIKQICDEMALNAGWHTVYVPNNRSRVKDRVKYERPFQTDLFCELFSRFRKKIIQEFNSTEGIKRESAPSKMYECVLRFMLSYKIHEDYTEGKLINRMCTSIRQRAIECNFEDWTKYHFNGFSANTENVSEYSAKLMKTSVEESSLDFAEEKAIKRDWRCAEEISLHTPIGGDKIANRTLEEVLEDTTYSNSITYRQDLEELEEKYTTSEKQKIMLNILLSAGKRMQPSKLLRELSEETGEPEEILKKEVYTFYTNIKQSLLHKTI